MSSSLTRRALVYGGNGTLGRAIVANFARQGWFVKSVDFSANSAASDNFVLPKNASWSESTEHLIEELAKEKASFNTLISAAGGWEGGDISDPSIFSQTTHMFEKNTQSAIAVAHLASRFMSPSTPEHPSLLVLTGATAALDTTPSMLAYGVSKVAVHHVVKSLAEPESGLPRGAKVAAILPLTIDTPMNRQFMPDADFDSWTKPVDFADQVLRWAKGDEDVHSGGLYTFETRQGETEVSLA